MMKCLNHNRNAQITAEKKNSQQPTTEWFINTVERSRTNVTHIDIRKTGRNKYNSAEKKCLRNPNKTRRV